MRHNSITTQESNPVNYAANNCHTFCLQLPVVIMYHSGFVDSCAFDMVVSVTDVLIFVKPNTLCLNNLSHKGQINYCIHTILPTFRNACKCIIISNQIMDIVSLHSTFICDNVICPDT